MNDLQLTTDTLADYWWKIRKEGLEIVILAERQLVAMGKMEPSEREVYSARELKQLDIGV